MIETHSYRAWGGDIRVVICHAPVGSRVASGMPGTRTTLLDEKDARDLLRQLTAALEGPSPCLDCGSDLHAAGSPHCSEERDCAD